MGNRQVEIPLDNMEQFEGVTTDYSDPPPAYGSWNTSASNEEVALGKRRGKLFRFKKR